MPKIDEGLIRRQSLRVLKCIEENHILVVNCLYSMHLFPPTFILRHRKENLKKCSLQGLQDPSILFFTYPKDPLPSLDDYILLTLDAPELTSADAEHGLLLIDGTWRHAQTMYRERIEKPRAPVLLRSLPKTWKTAYPRRQDDCSDPSCGLASIEALFAAYHILGRKSLHFLAHYHWKERFLQLNALAFFKNFGYPPENSGTENIP